MCVEKDELEDRGMAFHSGETTHGEAGEEGLQESSRRGAERTKGRRMRVEGSGTLPRRLKMRPLSSERGRLHAGDIVRVVFGR